MPCGSSHMNANEYEIEAGRLMLVLDELAGHRAITAALWARAGYDPRVYSKSPDKATMDQLTKSACAALQRRKDIGALSLELQVWWRDHQEADRLRALAEVEATTSARDRKIAIAKLTPYERHLLGLK